ncbi:hypothetical protein BT93_H2102 [Corymbia citriodora subsp. variegata]|nr:hypothetical protein BT93_H2102 [Corymbia citriodora subsp. variegata]
MLLPFLLLLLPIKISIPTRPIFLLLLLLLTPPRALPSSIPTTHKPIAKSLAGAAAAAPAGARAARAGAAMKVHPLPTKKRNITLQYVPRSAAIEAQALVGVVTTHHHHHHHKKLRRLPHIFSRVLELPFRADADVEVEEEPGFFRFVAETDGIVSDVRAHTIEIHPGVTKIVVRPNGSLELLSLDQLELDMWRFRLPESTRPELASAVCVNGELIVTVPKGEEEEDEAMVGGGNGGGRGGWGGGNGNKLVIVQ